MRKLMILLVLLSFAMAAPAFAAKAVLSDKEMGDINAGEWVGDNGRDNRQAITENSLKIDDTAQQYFIGVNNGNAVDSAIQMATNVATVTDAMVGVNQSNIADITNNRPKNVSNETSTKVESLTASFNKTITNTESITGDVNASETEGSKLFGLVGENNCSVVANLDASKDFDLVEGGSIEASENCSKSEDDSSALPQQNKLRLTDESQTNVTVVGNLNAVASGAAMQVNVATATAITGTVTQLNSATVVSGL